MTDRNELERLQPMTTEQKALALVNDARAKKGLVFNLLLCQVEHDPVFTALCRAIEAHEADNARNEQRLADQAKVFSDAMLVVQEYITGPSWDRGDRCEYIELAGGRRVRFADFILPEPEPDPLVEIAREMTLLDGVVRTDNQKAAIREGRAGNTASDDFYDRLRMALPARGYKIERIDND